MKTCPQCRQYCADQKITCPKCGANLDMQSDSSPQAPAHETIISDLCKTLDANPADDGIRRTLIEKYRAQGDWKNVAIHLRVLSEADPDDIELMEDLFQALKASGCVGEATLTLKTIIELRPGDSDIQKRMHDLITRSNFDLLSEGQRKALARCWVKCGDASLKIGETNNAADFFLKAYQACVGIGAGERLADLYSSWATTHEKGRAYSQAIAALSAALTYAPNDIALRNRLRNARWRRFRNRLLWRTATGLTIIVLAACCILYPYQERLEISIQKYENPTSPAKLIYDGWGTLQCLTHPLRFHWIKRGDTVWQSDERLFLTPLLPGGVYRMAVDVQRHQVAAEERIRIGFGRQIQAVGLVLDNDQGEPRLSIGRNSNPPLARIDYPPTPGGRLRLTTPAGSIIGFTDDLTSACFSVILERVWEKFKPPESLPGVKCVLKFDIHKNGATDNIHVIEGTRSEELNQLAVKAVETAKLPPLDGVWSDSIPVFVSFNYEWMSIN